MEAGATGLWMKNGRARTWIARFKNAVLLLTGLLYSVNGGGIQEEKRRRDWGRYVEY